MEPVNLVRLGIAIIAGMAFLFFAVRINDDWKGMSRGWRVTRLCLLGLVFIAVEGSLELMSVHPPVPLGPRNVLLPLFLVGLMLGLWLVRKDHNPMTGGWIRASEVADILNDIRGAEEAEDDGCHDVRCIRGRALLDAKIAHAQHREHL